MSEVATKDHILEATISAIEKHGLPGLTTRTIAAEAGVNNAALHYYFGTKEALIEAALTQTLHNMLVDTEEILGRRADLRDRLRALFGYLIEGRLPSNIIRAHLWSPLMEGKTDSPFDRAQESWTERIWREVRRESPGASESRIRLALQTALGGVIFMALMPPSGPGGRSLSLRNTAVRNRFIGQLVDFVLSTSDGLHPKGLRRTRSTVRPRHS
jgi:AcrR family transcriptional regulator